MLKICTYFFIPFLLYSSTYTMDRKRHVTSSNDESHSKKPYNLSYLAKGTLQVLRYAVSLNPNEDIEAVERRFALTIRGFIEKYYYEEVVQTNLPDNQKAWKFIEDAHDNNRIRGSKNLTAALNAIQKLGKEDQEETLHKTLLELEIVKKHAPLQPPLSGFKGSFKGNSDLINSTFSLKNQRDTETEDQEDSSNKKQDKKLKSATTDTLNNKELKIPDEKNKKSADPKKPTISQGFPFGKIIAIAGIIGTIALLYHKHSKAQELFAQAK